MKKKQIIISAVVVAIAIIGVILFVVLNSQKKTETPAPETTVEETTVEETTVDLHAGQTQSFLTGEYIDEKNASRRPVALMYNNIIDAIPHSGLSSASVCYEAPVEGCITRIMGIFEYDKYKNLKKMGSVRSCRIYYTNFALEWDAIYVHFGQSKYAVDFLKSGKIDNISAYQSIANTIFFRTTDRVAPHNCFITGKGINEGIKDLGYRKKYKDNYTSHFAFANENEKVDLASEKIANKVELGYQINKPWFEYDAATGLYKRFQYGEAHIDDQNNEQISCSNIIIQFVDTKLYPDNKSLDMTLTGSGSGWLITNGKAEKIQWNKTEKLGRTTYTDKSGNSITLNTGKTWICMVQNEYSDNVKISKAAAK